MKGSAKVREYKEIDIEKRENEEIYNHPAFGMVGFYHTHGGKEVLFGSSIEHNNTVVLELKHGYSRRGLHNDYFYGKGLIARVEMSFSQFAELISSPNNGSGVPCTIRYIEKEGRIPAITSNISKRKQFEAEFNEHLSSAMESIQDQITRIQESLSEKKNLGVKDRKEIISQLQQAKCNIGANLDFCANQFNEQMDKTVQEAKGEVEAFFQNRTRSIAQEALANVQNPVMITEEGDE